MNINTAKPKFSYCMAHYGDWNGFYFSVMAARQHHMDEHGDDWEFVIVDASSEAYPADAKAIKDYANKCPRMRYIPFPEGNGTTQPRQRCIDEAEGKYFLVTDCHVPLEPKSLHYLEKHFKANPGSNDLVSGPMLDDDRIGKSTHFNDFWREQMWGIWGIVWQCACTRLKFSCVPGADGGVKYVTLDMGLHPPEMKCTKCRMTIPERIDQWFGHEQYLEKAGFQMWHKAAPPEAFVTVPGQGLGAFAMRRDAWPGFNRNCTGFGGEEMTIHEKIRQAGGNAICLNGFVWPHRFYRGEKENWTPYPINIWERVRNYVLNFGDIKRPLNEIANHFVYGEKPYFAEASWKKLVEDPVNYKEDPGQLSAARGAAKAITYVDRGRPQPPAGMDFKGVVGWIQTHPRDLEKHVPMIAGFAGQCTSAAEFSGRRESLAALMCGLPGTLVSYNDEADDPLIKYLHELCATTPNTGKVFSTYMDSSMSIRVDIPEVDLLFLDTVHKSDHLLRELTRHAPKVKKFIMVHDTELYKEKDQDGRDGLGVTLDAWADNSGGEWFVAFHTAVQYGMTVLGRRGGAKQPPHRVRVIPIANGPGTQLKKILSRLGINPDEKCDCRTRMAQMDSMGVDGCVENIDMIKGWLYEGYKRWKWDEKLKEEAVDVAGPKQGILATIVKGFTVREGWGLGVKMLLSGNMTDPIPALIEMAIEAAQKSEAEAKKEST